MITFTILQNGRNTDDLLLIDTDISKFPNINLKLKDRLLLRVNYKSDNLLLLYVLYNRGRNYIRDE